jgi:hypothetical protein
MELGSAIVTNTIYGEKLMLTLAISPQGQVTLPNEILQMSTWKNSGQLVLQCLGDTVVL